MKKIFFVIIVFIIAILIKIPKYDELNNLAIIESVAVIYENKDFTIYLKEIIPIKDEQGINYEYEYYHAKSSSLEKTLQKIKSNTKKKIYLKKSKFLVTNYENSDFLKKKLNIKPKSIYHPSSDIYGFLKKLD